MRKLLIILLYLCCFVAWGQGNNPLEDLTKSGKWHEAVKWCSSHVSNLEKNLSFARLHRIWIVCTNQNKIALKDLWTAISREKYGHQFLGSFIKLEYSHNDFEAYKEKLRLWGDIAPDKKSIAAVNPMQKIVQYLAGSDSPCRDTRDRAYVLFYWVGRNLDYSHEAGISSEPDAVFRTGKSRCGGYASLFALLCKHAGLEAVTISGAAKGSFEQVVSFNHAWNAVRINNEWYLVDATWGGSVTCNGKIIKRYDDFFFMADPLRLRYTHFPCDQKWQLVATPISIEEFKKLPFLVSEFFRYNIKLTDERFQYNVINSGLVLEGLRLNSKKNCQIEIFQNGRNLDGLVEKSNNNERWSFTVKFPSPGEYVLRLYCGFFIMENVASYLVKVTNNAATCHLQ